MKLNQLLASVAIGVTLSSFGSAQDLVHSAAPQSSAVLIKNATVHTVTDGTLEQTSILFENGRIVAIGSADMIAAPDEKSRVIDAKGSHVYPGFVALASTMGLTEIGSVDMTLDTDEAGSISPEVRAGVSVNPDSWVIPVTRRNGVLTCGVMPTGGRVPGRASVIRMDGWTWEDLAIVPDVGLVINWPYVGPFGSDDEDGERAKSARKQLADIEELFDAASAYVAAREQDASIESDLRLNAMAGAIERSKKVFINANSLKQIESAVAWAVGRNLDFVLVGGHEAAQCLPLLARHDVPVAVTAAHRMPRRRDVSYREPYELPAKLQAAGVRWCLTYSPSSWTNSSQRNLPYEAAACIAFGLSEAEALHGITLAPAEFLGLGDQLGSLNVGKRATLFMTNGDALDPTTQVLAAFIDGREIDLTDKQTALDDKYRAKYRQLKLLR
ncbi:MAG: imidazolonepropionase-like amidohydrolase [Planctomycetota bacterium]|jgi:imidazolonepropionase-like amidohydrolase